MNDENRIVLQTHFRLEQKKSRVTLFAVHTDMTVGYETARIGKVEQGDNLYFTIGETRRGRELELSPRIEALIKEEGLEQKSVRTRENTYPGFSMRNVDPDVLSQLLERVLRIVEEGAAT